MHEAPTLQRWQKPYTERQIDLHNQAAAILVKIKVTKDSLRNETDPFIKEFLKGRLQANQSQYIETMCQLFEPIAAKICQSSF